MKMKRQSRDVLRRGMVCLFTAMLLLHPVMTVWAVGGADGIRLKKCDALGKLVDSGKYESFKTLDGGYIEVSRKDGNTMHYGILDRDGKEILPCNLDAYEQISDSLIVISVVGKETDNKDEAMFFRTGRNFTLGHAKSGEKMYTGHLVVYDLKQKKELAFTKLTKPGPDRNRIVACKDSLYVIDDNQKHRIYDLKGKILEDDAKHLTPCKPFYFANENNTYIVYNDKLEKLFERKSDDISLTPSNSKQEGSYLVFQNRSTKKYGLMDASGKELAKAEYDFVNTSNNSGFLCVKKGDKKGILDEKGKKVTECEYRDISFLRDGYASAFKMDDNGKKTCTLIGPDGILLKDSAEKVDLYTMIASRESGKQYEYFLLKDKKFSLKQERLGANKAFCLLEIKDPVTNHVGLVETISGKEVLDTKYKKIEAEGGYVYAYLDGKCEAYRVEVSTK